MFNTSWTDLVLKVGGQLLFAVIVILVVTFGADPFFPTENVKDMILSRSAKSATNVSSKSNVPKL